MLQKESLDYGSAASLIQVSIQTFESMRSDGQLDLLWQESVAFANHHGIEMSHPRSRRQRHTPTAMESYVLTPNNSDCGLYQSYQVKTTKFMYTLLQSM